MEIVLERNEFVFEPVPQAWPLAVPSGYLSSEGLLRLIQSSWSLSDHLKPSPHVHTPQCHPPGFARELGSSFVLLL